MRYHDKNGPLANEELLEIVDNDEFWKDEESLENAVPQSGQISEDEQLLQRDKSYTDFFVYGDESDQDEEDIELVSELEKKQPNIYVGTVKKNKKICSFTVYASS